MRIKLYRGSDLQSALARVKAELGSDAVLLSTRNLGPKEATVGEKVEVSVAVEGHQALPSAEKGSFDQKMTISRIEENIAHIRAMMSIAQAKETVPLTINTNPGLRLFFERIISAGVDERLTLDLMNRLINRLPEDPPKDMIQTELAAILKEALVVSPEPGRKRIRWALVGPTGAGKTTTLAKLAAHFALSQGRSTALITVDTYRLAAADQLKAYARLMGLELTVAFNRDELRQALRENSDKEVILLDTAGRSQHHLLNMNELKMLVREVEGLKHWLVLPATTKDQDMASACEKFMEVGLNGLIFTKLDETVCYGPLINQVLQYRLPVAYLTAGQRVPEDIEPATQERLLRLVLNDALSHKG